MSKRLNLTGRKFGRLVVLDKVDYSNRTHWLCECKCGIKKFIPLTSLMSGHSRSCGCLKAEIDHTKLVTHGRSNTFLYTKWELMQRRLRTKHLKKNRCYKNISCEWPSFESFYKDMNRKFLNHVKKFGVKDTSLDRIDNTKNYSKENCRWVTLREQGQNTSKVIWVKYKNKKYNLAELCEITGLKYRTLLGRVTHNWSIEKIINTKAYKGRNQFDAI